jgi:hypothetical protein
MRKVADEVDKDHGDKQQGYSSARLLTMIVMATSGRVAIPGVITGNPAEEVLPSCGTFVLAVKPDGYLSLLA